MTMRMNESIASNRAMRTNSLWAMGLIWTAVLGASACGSETPSDEDYDDLASAMGALVSDDSGGSEVVVASDVVQLADVGAAPAGLALTSTGTYSGPRGQLDYEYAVECFDASGRARPNCGFGSTSAQIEVEVSGEASTARRQGSFRRMASWEINDVGSGTLTISGGGTIGSTASFRALLRPVSRDWSLDATSSHTDVQVRTSDGRLVGGRMTWDLLAELSATRDTNQRNLSFAVDVELEVTDPGEGVLTLDGTRSYAIDLNDGTITPIP